VLLVALVLVVATSGAASGSTGGDWALANHDLSSTRADPASGIDRANVRTLHVAWRFRFGAPAGASGVFTATPVVADGVVYVQDMESNVFALDLKTGAVRWDHRFFDETAGPNGVVVDGGRVYGATDTSVFALSAASGKLLWTRLLETPTERYVDVAPQVASGTVYTSTVGVPPNGRGALYALSAATGKVRWRLSTIKGPWRVPSEAGGGGAWYPPSVADGTAYWGTANPYPYGGTQRHPNGGAFAGPALYTDSLVAVSSAGKVAWYDQVTPHDVRDYDFQLSPVLATLAGRSLVFGAGKAGIVLAWDRASHRRVWQVKVGVHRNDSGPLPRRRTTVCPGLLGGVETPMAYAGGTLFVPVVDLCMRGSSVGYEDVDRVDVAKRGRGELVALDAATGKREWRRSLPHAVFGCATVARGVVFTATLDGTISAFDTRDGTPLWSARAHGGVNSCPSIAGDTLLVGAGVPAAGGVNELEAYRP
jgi:outer membrane protein assembly factor BamB